MMSSTLRLSQRAEWAEGQPISDLMSRALADPRADFAGGRFRRSTDAARGAHARGAGVVVRPRVLRPGGTAVRHDPGLSAAARSAAAVGCWTSDACCHELSIDQIVITAGSNQLLHLVCESLLDPGDIVLCACSHLPRVSGHVEQCRGTVGGCRHRPVRHGAGRARALPAAVARARGAAAREGHLSGARISTIPAASRCRWNVVHASWRSPSAGRDGQQIHVIADEAYRDLRYEGDDVPSTLTVDDEGDTVIVTGTFSKSFSPGIRVGWGVLPRHLIAPGVQPEGQHRFWLTRISAST